MTSIDEDVLHAASFINHSAGRMEAIRSRVELTFPSQQARLAPPLASLPVSGRHAPQPDLHAITLAADDLETSSNGVERQVHRVHIAWVLPGITQQRIDFLVLEAIRQFTGFSDGPRGSALKL